jgi:hypothetical protein
MECYPRDLPPQAVARVEVDRLRAVLDLERFRREPESRLHAGRYGFGWTAAEEDFIYYVLSWFSSFSLEACKMGLDRKWNILQVQENVQESLRLFVINAYDENGHDRRGRKIPTVTTSGSGFLRPELTHVIRTSAQWLEYQQRLGVVAQTQAQDSPEYTGLISDVQDVAPADPERAQEDSSPPPVDVVTQTLARDLVEPTVPISHVGYVAPADLERVQEETSPSPVDVVPQTLPRDLMEPTVLISEVGDVAPAGPERVQGKTFAQPVFPGRAAWLRTEMDKLNIDTANEFHSLGGPDVRSIHKVLDGLPVGKVVLHRIVKALNKIRGKSLPEINHKEVPND